MSIFVGHLSKRAAVLVTDSWAVSNAGHKVECTKTIALPHLHLIYSTIGVASLETFLSIELQYAGIPGNDFDGLAPRVEALLAAGYERMLAATGDAITVSGEKVDACQAMFLGWSARAGSPAGLFFQKSDAGAAFEAVAAAPGYFAIPPVPAAVSAAAIALEKKQGQRAVLLALATAIKQQTLQQTGMDLIGGRLIETTLSRNLIEQRVIHTYPPT